MLGIKEEIENIKKDAEDKLIRLGLLEKELKKSGLYVAVLIPPNNEYIYISWKIDEISQKARNRLLLE